MQKFPALDKKYQVNQGNSSSMHRTHASRSRASEPNEQLNNMLYDVRGEFGSRAKVSMPVSSGDRQLELPEFFLNTRVYDAVLADFLAAATAKLQRLHHEIHRIKVVAFITQWLYSMVLLLLAFCLQDMMVIVDRSGRVRRDIMDDDTLIETMTEIKIT